MLGIEAGLPEDLLVVEEHHRIALPRHQVVPAVRGTVLLGERAAASLNAPLPLREVVIERDQPFYFSNCGTDAGAMFNVRLAVPPATMGALITSSGLCPRGCCAR
ncbi:hypothetical protein [Wenjunlia vitaminophila]|uniref:hypothetical protein n=1 Tax=Wenjunlia vitaminophila TaxID=76728 RepID=UPI0012FE8154|nr:hypothetical protein [Wenjunlia vitaminophila]